MKKKFSIAVWAFLVITAVIVFVQWGNAQVAEEPWPEALTAVQVPDCNSCGHCFLSNTVGDLNGTGTITPADIILLDRLMRRIHVADVNGDTKVDNNDIEYLTNYVYYGGPGPKIPSRCFPVRVNRICP
jgi:hypothetical protein